MVQLLIYHNQDKITWFTISSTEGPISILHSLLQAKEKKKHLPSVYSSPLLVLVNILLSASWKMISQRIREMAAAANRTSE